MIWLDSPDTTAAALPAAWLVATEARPANLAERSRLRRDMARRIAARQLGLPAADVSIDHDEMGRPLLGQPRGLQLHLSLATRAGVVAVGLAQQPVGIDVERVDPTAALPLSILHPLESAMLRALPHSQQAFVFARLWCAKEAYVKALGVGFSRAPDSFAVTLSSSDRFEIADPLRAAAATCTSRTIENGGQEILAAAMVMLDRG